MSTTLATPSNTQVKVRWEEQYVSEGLNKKLTGVIPEGVIRGGRLIAHPSINMNVTVESDTGSGDSVFSYVDANGHQLSFRQVGDVNLDLTAEAGNTVYIGLEIVYVISSVTQVFWRAYSAAEVVADPTLLIIGSVIVPAAGLVPAGDVRGNERKDGGLDLSSGMRDWQQTVENSDFQQGRNFAASSYSRDLPNWQLDPGALGTVGRTTSQARTGDASLQFVGAGGGSHDLKAKPIKLFSVLPGQTIKVSAFIKGVSVVLGSGAGASVSLAVTALDEGGSAVVAGDFSLFGSWFHSEDGTVINGSFDWFEMGGRTTIPAGVAWLAVTITIVDGTSFTGDIFFDDVQLWVEPGPVADSYDRKDEMVGADTYTPGLVVTPAWGQDAVITSYQKVLDRAIRFLCKDAGIATLEYLMETGDASISDWLLNITRGQLKLGEGLISGVASAAKPRGILPFPLDATAPYTLLWEMPHPTTGKSIRIYVAESPVVSTSERLVITINALWTGTQWQRDENANNAIRFDFSSSGGITIFARDATASATWIDTDWDDGGVNSERTCSLGLGFLGSPIGGNLTLADGILIMSPAGTVTNPSAGSLLALPNALYGKNIVKSWGMFQVAAGVPTLLGGEGFNISGLAVTIGGELDITFQVPMANANYATPLSIFSAITDEFVVWNQTTNVLTLALVNHTLGSKLDLNIDNGIGAFTTCAQQ